MNTFTSQEMINFAAFFVLICVHLNSVNSYITWIEARLPLQGTPPAPGTPWPIPQKWITSDQVIVVYPSLFSFTSNALHCDVIKDGFERYKDIIFDGDDKYKGNFNSPFPYLDQLIVYVQNPQDCYYPKLDDDEYYNIKIDPNQRIFTLNSRSIWGALRGLETFSQLVYQHPITATYLINATEIEDWPEFKHRGLLLDTARHFIPMKTLLLNLDAMAYNKLNVFHWHLVDDQSFPFESRRFPNLTKFGAYTPKHIYTQEDVRLIIRYARMRGIRVIPELDSPGHTKVFGNSYPDLLTPCYGDGVNPYTPNNPHHSEADFLNPIKEHTYSFMNELFNEIKSVFVDEFIHLGMDEVYYACWKSNPNIAHFMRKNNMTKINQVEQYYVRRTIANVKRLGYKYIMWQDPVDNGVTPDPDSIIQVWKDTELDQSMKSWKEYIVPIAKQGYRLLVSGCWYLNYITYPYPGKDWEKYYLCNPRDFIGTDQQKNQVIGGEACLWSEFVDSTNLISRLWPRASAVAERLWTNPYERDVDTVRFRLDQQRCRMVQRGIAAAPILNGFCGSHEWDLKPTPKINPGQRIKDFD